MNFKPGSLDAQVAAGPLPPDTVREIVRDVLSALETLHQQNSLHGAIRPANLYVDGQGRVRLSDTSSTLRGREQRPSGGPAKYLAPEQVQPAFGDVGPATDLYCLGFTALELLKGPAFGVLFPSVDPAAIDGEIAWMRWHSSPTEKVPPVAAVIPDVPGDLATVLDRMLQKQVRDRYATARAALADLAPVAEPSPAWTAAAAGSRTDVARRVPARPTSSGWRVPLALAVLLLAAVVCFVLWPKSDKIAVSIASVPPRAKVFINKAPVESGAKLELAAGAYLVRLELPDYEPVERTIEVSPQRRFHTFTLNKVHIVAAATIQKPVVPPSVTPTTVTPTPEKPTLEKPAPEKPLPEKPAPEKPTPVIPKKAPPVERPVQTVMLQSNPPGADVYINDKLQPKKTNGAFEVDKAPFTVKLVYKGLLPVVAKLDPSRLDKAVTFMFDRAVTLRSEPPGATMLVDGKEIKDKTPALVNLPPGQYKVSATLAGYAAADKTIDVTDAVPEQEFSLELRSLPPQKRALLVGVRAAIKALPSFSHAEGDVEALGRALRVGGFGGDKVAILTQLRAQVKQDEVPDAKNIRQRLRALVAASTPVDECVVALVGHAVDLPDDKGKNQAYFCPAYARESDPTTLLPLNEIVETLAQAPSPKKLLILDCWRKDWKGGGLACTRSWNKEPPKGLAILYACAVGQTGYEHTSERHGAFTHFVIQGLLGEAAPAKVTDQGLFEFCKRQVPRLVTASYRDANQVPVLATSTAPWVVTTPGPGTADYVLGCAQLEKKNYDGAIEAFARAAKALPDLVEIYLKRSEAWYRKGKFDEASADCQTALKLDPNNATAYSNLAESQAAHESKDFAAANKNFTKAIDLDPGYARGYNIRGLGFIISQDYEAAIKDFTEAIRLQPQLVVAWNNRGIAEYRRKRLDEAKADFDQAIALDDKQPDPFVGRGNVWIGKKDLERAIEDYSAAIKLDGSNPNWLYTRSLLYRNVDKLDNAIDDAKNAIALKPESKFWVALGRAYDQKKVYVMAAEALDKAVQLDPKSATTHRLLSAVYSRAKDDTKAKLHKKIADQLEMK